VFFMSERLAEQQPISQVLQEVCDLLRSPEPANHQVAVIQRLTSLAVFATSSYSSRIELATHLEAGLKQTIDSGVSDSLSEYRLALEQIEAERQMLDNFLESANAGTWEWDITTGTEIFDARCAAIAGYTLEELSEQHITTWDNFTHPEDLVVSNELLQRCIDGTTDNYMYELRIKHKNGQWVWVEDRGKVFARDNYGRATKILGTSVDITERKQKEEALKEFCIKDPLTDLYNSRHFESKVVELEQTRRREYPISVFYIDVDGLKSVNDVFGHKAGNDLIQRLAQILKDTFRPEDCVARLGGDEFAVILSGVDEHSLPSLTERLDFNLNNSNLEHPEILLSISVGTATAPESSLLRLAIATADSQMLTLKRAKGSSRS
jgi:diguanylate cyclase (GGDEF)-like protein/PAS domain S-box-containing protein